MPPTVWAGHMYWISPAYARHMLDAYGELPMEQLAATPEHQLTHPSGGLVSWPSLALQDVIDSTLRPEEDLEGHLVCQAAWSYRDYSDCEQGDHRSPLAGREPPRRTIGLCVHVRDDSEAVERCLASVRPLIDTWAFGADRNELVELARGTADYLLLLDADQTVEHTGPLRPLEADIYALRYPGELGYAGPRLLRGDLRWRFEGPNQDQLAVGGEPWVEVLEGLVVNRAPAP